MPAITVDGQVIPCQQRHLVLQTIRQQMGELFARELIPEPAFEVQESENLR